MAAVRRRKRPKRYHHGNLPSVLLEIGLEVLESEGLEKLTLRKVTDLAGVSPSAPYNHFPDRKNLLIALATKGFHLLKAEQEQAAASVDRADVPAFIRALGQGYLAFAQRRPNLFELMFSSVVSPPSAHPELEQVSLEVFAMLTEPLGELMEQRQAGFSGSIGTATVSVAAWSLCHGVTTLLLNQGIVLEGTDADTPNALMDQVTDIFFASLNSS